MSACLPSFRRFLIERHIVSVELRRRCPEIAKATLREIPCRAEGPRRCAGGQMPTALRPESQQVITLLAVGSSPSLGHGTPKPARASDQTLQHDDRIDRPVFSTLYLLPTAMDALVKVEADPPPLERSPSPPPGSQTRPIQLSSPTPPPAPLPAQRRHPPWPSRKHRRKKPKTTTSTNSFAHSAAVEPNERTVHLRSGRDVTIQAHRDRDRIKGPATGKRGKRKGKRKGKKRSGNGVKAEPGAVKVKREPGVKVKQEPR